MDDAPKNTVRPPGWSSITSSNRMNACRRVEQVQPRSDT